MRGAKKGEISERLHQQQRHEGKIHIRFVSIHSRNGTSTSTWNMQKNHIFWLIQFQVSIFFFWYYPGTLNSYPQLGTSEGKKEQLCPLRVNGLKGKVGRRLREPTSHRGDMTTSPKSQKQKTTAEKLMEALWLVQWERGSNRFLLQSTPDTGRSPNPPEGGLIRIVKLGERGT